MHLRECSGNILPLDNCDVKQTDSTMPPSVPGSGLGYDLVTSHAHRRTITMERCTDLFDVVASGTLLLVKIIYRQCIHRSIQVMTFLQGVDQVSRIDYSDRTN